LSNESKSQLIQHILALFRAIDGDMGRLDEAASAKLGLSRTDFRCLDILSRGTSMTPGQLAQEVGLSTGATTALLDRLQRRGFVRRKHDRNDRRRVLVQPTKRSINEVWPIFEGLVAGVTQLMQQFSFDELETIRNFLERQRTVVRGHLPDNRPTPEKKRSK